MLSATYRVAKRHVTTYFRNVAAVWTPLPDPPPTQEELQRKSAKKPISWARFRTAFVLTKADYVESWRTVLPSRWLPQPAKTPEENAAADESVTAKVALDALRFAGRDALQNAKEMSPDARERVRAFAHDKLLVAKEALKEFIEGYQEGRAEEVERHRLEVEEELREASVPTAQPANPSSKV